MKNQEEELLLKKYGVTLQDLTNGNISEELEEELLYYGYTIDDVKEILERQLKYNKAISEEGLKPGLA